MKSKKNNSDYLLADRSVKPWLVSLSAVASANSGYMFIGMIGYTYTVGLSAIWLMIGWILGDLFASYCVHKKLRIACEKEDALSFAGVLAKFNGTNFKKMRALGGLFTLLFLGTYAAAQLSAGSKALHVLLGWDYKMGAIIGAIIVVGYCFAGGIRASIWTDAAQSVVMIASMSILVYAACNSLGGFSSALVKLDAVSENYLSLFPSDLAFGPVIGPIAFALGWLFGGFGVVGQPHIMVRFMAMDSVKNLNRVRVYYYTWYTLFSLLTVFCGLLSRLMLSSNGSFDPELALPTMALQILPKALVGLILAGLFSATMSTADSQILSCTAALTRDFPLFSKVTLGQTKLATLLITLGALLIALFASASVFSLVVVAWAALSVSFGPLLFAYSMNQKMSENVAITMMLSGLATMILWRYFGLSTHVYEVLPGMLVGFVPLVIDKLRHQQQHRDTILKYN